MDGKALVHRQMVAPLVSLPARMCAAFFRFRISDARAYSVSTFPPLPHPLVTLHHVTLCIVCLSRHSFGIT